MIVKVNRKHEIFCHSRETELFPEMVWSVFGPVGEIGVAPIVDDVDVSWRNRNILIVFENSDDWVGHHDHSIVI